MRSSPPAASGSGISEWTSRFTAEEQAFAAEVRAWLAAQPRARRGRRRRLAGQQVEWGRAWQAKLAADRWVGIHWPAAYGGRGATPVEVAIFNMEYAAGRRAAAGQPGRHQPRRARRCSPTAPRSRSSGGCRAILDAGEIWCQLFSEPDAGSDLAARTRAEPAHGPDDDGLAGQRARRSGPATRSSPAGASGSCAPTRTAAKHRGISFLVVDMQAPGIEVRPLRADHRRARVQRGVLRRGRSCPTTTWSARSTTAGRWRARRWPTSGARPSRSRSRSSTRSTSTSCGRARPRRGRLDDVEVADALVAGVRRAARPAPAQLAHALAPGRGHRAGAGVELGEARVDRHDPATSRRPRSTWSGPSAPLWGRWPRQWLWSKAASIAGGTSEVQRTIIGDRILGLPAGSDFGFVTTSGGS